jgi:ferrous iron transport protein A
MNNHDDRVHHWLKSIDPPPWEGFTYLGDRGSTSVVSSDSARSPTMTLLEAVTGDRLQITALPIGDQTARLRGMGLMPGVVLEVVSRLPSGSVVVRLGDQRLGLSAELAPQISVVLASDPPGLSPSHTNLSHANLSHTDPSHTISIPMSSSLSPSPKISLLTAAVGDRLRVVGYATAAAAYKRKLLAMGLTPGTELTVLRHAPLGDPTEIAVRGFHLSLRKQEAEALYLESLHPGDGL